MPPTTPSTPNDRLAVLQSNYNQAHDSEPSDLAATKSVQEVAAVQLNLAQARALFFNTVAADLEGDDQSIEDACSAAKTAQQKIADDRDAVQRPIAWLNDLTGATSAAQNLVVAIQNVKSG